MTRLRDETLHPTADFKELYRLRWGIETFFGLLKTRLGLENFTGKSAESVYQDFYSTVYLTGVESILTESSQP
ncbi:transposase [Beggiatoa alba]|uniref:transposase n=1 Tax=Beggiatoa alba TaxID=1022 RepID=UPI0038CC1AED